MKCQLVLFTFYFVFLCTFASSPAEDLSSGTVSSDLKTQLSFTQSINETIADKLKRLRTLRAEVKSLAAELRENKIEEIISDSKKGTDSTESIKKKDKKRWKKRIQKRIGRLSKRLSKLERAVIAQQDSIKSTRGKTLKQGQKIKSTASAVVQTTTTVYQQLKSRPGYHKSSCKTHNDCLPGHCCHKSEETSQCIRHALNETSVCRHSCQCNSDLHCFRRKTSDDNVAQSHCKRAHISDFSQGTYENAKQGIFDV